MDVELLNELKQEKANLESIRQLVSTRKQLVLRYGAVANYVKGKGSSEEVEKFRDEMNGLKDLVEKYNKSIQREYEDYEKSRNVNLKMIMGCVCYADSEKSKKSIEVATKQQDKFPLYDSQMNSSPTSKDTEEDFESVDINSFES